MIPPAKHGGRKRTIDVREILNGIFYVLWTGCQGQALPKETYRRQHRLSEPETSSLRRALVSHRRCIRDQPIAHETTPCIQRSVAVRERTPSHPAGGVQRTGEPASELCLHPSVITSHRTWRMCDER
jgi:hypothetical protein